MLLSLYLLMYITFKKCNMYQNRCSTWYWIIKYRKDFKRAWIFCLIKFKKMERERESASFASTALQKKVNRSLCFHRVWLILRRPQKCPSDRYTAWSMWSPCSSSCGPGVKLRSRQIDKSWSNLGSDDEDTHEECKVQQALCTAEISCNFTREEAMST